LTVSDDPEYKTLELYGYSYKLKDCDYASLFDALRYQRDGFDNSYEDWMMAEAAERLLPKPGVPHNPGEAWRIREDFWGRFIRSGVFSYSYTERWQAQLPYVVRGLKDKPNSRHALITMYDRHEDMLNWGGYDRVPCSVSYQFMIREDKLHVIYNQRSCDFVNFFLADVYFTLKLRDYVASEVGVEVGDFTHFLGSLHAFAGDLKGKEIF
jgi:thymidylate synthase